MQIAIILAVYALFVCIMLWANHKLTKVKAPRLSDMKDKPAPIIVNNKDFYPDGSPRWEWRG